MFIRGFTFLALWLDRWAVLNVATDQPPSPAQVLSGRHDPVPRPQACFKNDRPTTDISIHDATRTARPPEQVTWT